MAADYPFPSYHQQQNNLPKAKKQFPRLKTVPSQLLQTNVRRLHDAWDFFQKRGYGFPRFKKYGQMKSMLSVIETCRRRQVNPWTYIAEVITLGRKGITPPPVPAGS
jgi:transposase